ncbi:hypothetical protein BCV72DRAFT_308435 [Rhizopus microsporus var. microsporus]|uniref:Uncharacterized protein n=1 Tax=Rhizopus microsporus var. microsporus TaxID=86635 RepID=A0A1X0QU08_RHIZD|nr:hypothetical protein BCV72DRAFT_308435 [Rhizopus microsporus var. microsporus]
MLPQNLRPYVSNLKKHTKVSSNVSKGSPAQVTKITNQYHAFDQSRFIFYNYQQNEEKRKQKEVEKTDEKSTKKLRSYLRRKNVEDEPVFAAINVTVI